uniref:Transposase IS30-like HTH domain-containing protein n=1 Tax=Bactrocera latifrons TaxID=174628 RepID=A0A0K8WHA5_BACLA
MGRGQHCRAELRKQIKHLHNQGFSYRKIAETLNYSKRMVENAIKYKPQKETRGRKSKISPTLERNRMRFLKKDPFSSSSELKKIFSLDVDTSTIRKWLINKNLKAKRPRKVPFLSNQM